MGNAGTQEANTVELLKLLAMLQQGDGGGGKAGGKTKSGGGMGGILGNK